MCIEMRELAHGDKFLDSIMGGDLMEEEEEQIDPKMEQYNEEMEANRSRMKF